MALNVKKGDNVLIIAGKDKGKTGKVLVSMPADNSVVVAGVNIVSKHKKPKNANDKGGIIKKESKIDASNVQVICPTCGKATRIANGKDGDKKVRLCKKCGANLDVVKKTTKEATKPTKKVETKKVESETKDTKSVAKKTAPKTSNPVESKTDSNSAEKKSATKSTTTKKSTTKKVESK